MIWLQVTEKPPRDSLGSGFELVPARLHHGRELCGIHATLPEERQSVTELFWEFTRETNKLQATNPGVYVQTGHIELGSIASSTFAVISTQCCQLAAVSLATTSL